MRSNECYTYLTSQPKTYTEEDLYLIIESKHGWTVASQFSRIMNGKPLDEYNPNALYYILLTLQSREPEIADEIRNYLEEIEYDFS